MDHVLHRANKAGGHETRSLHPQGPEHAALRMALEDKRPSGETT